MTTHLTSWTCERCTDTACEVISEEARPPTHCPYNLLASWHQVQEAVE